MADSTSRLLVNSNAIRETLKTRNLYTPDVEYPQNQNTAQKVVDTIGSISSALMPFSGFDLKNTVLGRVVNGTPLTTIGTIMLGKQLLLNSQSHLAQQALPIINVSNLFDGNKNTKLFTKKLDLKITKKEQTKFQNFLDNLTYSNPQKDNPFNNDPTNTDYIKNTSTGQLSFLYSNLNRNIYKQDDSTLSEYAIKAGTELQPRFYITGTKEYFNLRTNYTNYNRDFDAQSIADKDMRISYDDSSKISPEYAPTLDYINNNFGKTNLNEIDSNLLGLDNDVEMNGWVENNSDDISKIVWGRDGTDVSTDFYLSNLRDDISQESVDLKSKFNVRAGLLEYTRNLINATDGEVGDITRKAFTKDGKLVGFNGSTLWRAPSTAFPEFKNKVGVRQHTMLDQYGKFAKAIRFNGNNVYGGNVDSVIYNTVLPRIHPTMRENVMNNKNLMFSIENLAVRVIGNNTYGIIDDEFGSPIPMTEVGAFNGRVMWFPPYNMEINEIATAKYESTVMVGRNEPMYNYINSERSATLNFTLLVDYPPQLKNYKGTDKKKKIAEFFAFGGENYNEEFVPIEDLELKETQLTQEIEPLNNNPIPDIVTPTPINIYFPNDEPKVGTESTYFDRMYNDCHYEILGGLSPTSCDGKSSGLNYKLYFITGLTNTEDGWQFNKVSNFSQYSVKSTNDQFGKEPSIDKMLKLVFTDERNWKLYTINIVAGSSKLYDIKTKEAVYNEALAKRRADATQSFIEARLNVIFGKTANEMGIKFNFVNKGSTEADVKNGTEEAIAELSTKLERYSTINVVYNGKVETPTTNQLSDNDKKTIVEKQQELESVKTLINKKKNPATFYKEREKIGEDGLADSGNVKGFGLIQENYYAPAFHSQTPEDFHKRLTFLQQCTRQGSAKRYDNYSEDGNLTAKNSAFGRQPICILRVGDFFYTKVIIESVNIDYNDTTWDMNPEGFGMQPMIAKVTLSMKLIGGQSLKGPIDALQNAVSFNYYANSSFSKEGLYKLPSDIADKQASYINGVLSKERDKLTYNYLHNILKVI